MLQEMATAEHKKQQVSDRTATRQREGLYTKRPYLSYVSCFFDLIEWPRICKRVLFVFKNMVCFRSLSLKPDITSTSNSFIRSELG